ncbi:hypothetical protein RFI_29775, partial [Reticulomyxa filosa]
MGGSESIEQKAKAATQKLHTVAQEAYKSISTAVSNFAEERLKEGYLDNEPMLFSAGYTDECQVCHEEKPISDLLSLQNCGHLICPQCLLSHVHDDIHNIAKYPLKCPVLLTMHEMEPSDINKRPQSVKTKTKMKINGSADQDEKEEKLLLESVHEAKEANDRPRPPLLLLPPPPLLPLLPPPPLLPLLPPPPPPPPLLPPPPPPRVSSPVTAQKGKDDAKGERKYDVETEECKLVESSDHNNE